MACLSPLARTDLPRSPSPSVRPLTMSPLAGLASMTMMDTDETEGKGWEISFDTDTEDEEEEGPDFTMDIPWRDSKDSHEHSPDGAEYK
jgi:hypothetical protein